MNVCVIRLHESREMRSLNRAIMSNCLQLLKDNSIVYESQKDKAGRFVSTVFILKPIQEKKSGEDVEHKTDPKIDQN